MNGYIAAFVLGIIIACVWCIIRVFCLASESSSASDFWEKIGKIGEDKRKQRQAYWNHGMTRRDWFWWGRW